MNCPNDNTVLSLSERQGVEIDYCPQCRGVWLDRGELDKLIEKASQDIPQQQNTGHQPRAHHDTNRSHDRHQDHDRDYDDDYRSGHHGKRKKSMLGDIFDF